MECIIVVLPIRFRRSVLGRKWWLPTYRSLLVVDKQKRNALTFTPVTNYHISMCTGVYKSCSCSSFKLSWIQAFTDRSVGWSKIPSELVRLFFHPAFPYLKSRRKIVSDKSAVAVDEAVEE
jgi:hypothetical protein